MELLRELLKVQHERGCVDEAALREVAQRDNVPLYRLEELVSFYPHFRRTPPVGHSIEVCRDGVCAMADCAGWKARLADRLAVTIPVARRDGATDSDFHAVGLSVAVGFSGAIAIPDTQSDGLPHAKRDPEADSDTTDARHRGRPVRPG